MATRTWNGGGNDDLWSNANNWGGTAPVAGDALVFTGSTRPNAQNDFTDDTEFASITLSSASTTFTLSGNRITCNGTITHSSGAYDSYFSVPIRTTTGVSIVAGIDGGTLYLGGVISGAGNVSFDRLSTNTHTMRINAACTYTGSTTVADGITLRLNGSGNIGSTSGVNLVGTTSILYFAVISASRDFSRVISGAGYVQLYADPANVLTLSGASTYTGTTWIAYGTLSVSSINSVSGGTTSSNLGAPTTAANGKILMGYGAGSNCYLIYTGSGETTDRVIAPTALANVQSIVASGSGLLKFTSNISYGPGPSNGSFTFTLAGTGTAEFAGVLSDPSAGGRVITVEKTGSGTWTLSAANTFTGSTKALDGNLKIGNGGTTGSLSTSSAITVTSPGVLTFNRSNTTTSGTDFKDGISGTGAVTNVGSGTVVFTGTQTYSGETNVSAGALRVTGALNGTGAVSVASGATLEGNGTINGAITSASGSIISPGFLGTPIAQLNTAAVSAPLGSTINVNLDGVTPTFDKISSSGTVTLGGTLSIAGYSNPTTGKVFTIIGAVTLSGAFNGQAEGSTITFNTRTLRVNYPNNTVTLTDITSSVNAILCLIP